MAKIIESIELTPLQVQSLGRERQEIIALREIIAQLTIRVARTEYEQQRRGIAKSNKHELEGAPAARSRPKGGKHGR